MSTKIRRTKYFLACSLCIVLLQSAMAIGATVSTIATFADPAAGPSTPLFTVDVSGGAVTGGWNSTGLNLDVPGVGTYMDAIFTMTPLSYTGTIVNGTGSGGNVSFYEAGDVPGTDDPIVKIEFDSVQLSPGSMYATELLSLNDVVISGTVVPGGLTQESFSFAFANQQLLPTGGQGFTATASFTSSALIPEPTVLAYMVIAFSLGIRRRRR